MLNINNNVMLLLHRTVFCLGWLCMAVPVVALPQGGSVQAGSGNIKSR